jgi:hypothetical protein
MILHNWYRVVRPQHEVTSKRVGGKISAGSDILAIKVE